MKIEGLERDSLEQLIERRLKSHPNLEGKIVNDFSRQEIKPTGTAPKGDMKNQALVGIQTMEIEHLASGARLRI